MSDPVSIRWNLEFSNELFTDHEVRSIADRLQKSGARLYSESGQTVFALVHNDGSPAGNWIGLVRDLPVAEQDRRIVSDALKAAEENVVDEMRSARIGRKA